MLLARTEKRKHVWDPKDSIQGEGKKPSNPVKEHPENKGVVTLSEYKKRMRNYYLREQEEKAGFRKKDRHIIERYFRFLNRFQLGGPLAHAARKADTPTSTCLGWLEGNQPRGIRIASNIPNEGPSPGQLWLPLRFKGG